MSKDSIVIKFQKLESLAIVVALLILYSRLDYSWLWFVLLFLVPDAFMVGYFNNPKVGAIIYNVGHSYFVPVLIWILSLFLDQSFFSAIAIIWAAHIAADRMLGFGLKLYDGFKKTHLGDLK